MVGEKKTIRIVVSGKVQGVFFRKHTRQKAMELGLEGEVKNEPDGSVCILATGSGKQLEALVSFCYKGPPTAKVNNVTVEECNLQYFHGFIILK